MLCISDYLEDFREQLIKERKKRGWSKARMADELSVSAVTIRNIEDNTYPHHSTRILQKIADNLGKEIKIQIKMVDKEDE